MNILFSFLFLGVVAWYVVLIFRAEGDLKNFFWSALILKSFAGICLGMVYAFHYKVGDTLLFYGDAVKLSDFAKTHPGSYLYFLFTSDFAKDLSVNLTFEDQRAVLMVKITSLFSLLSFDNYWLITVYMTVISFLGSWYLVKQINTAFPEATGSALVAFLFVPSIVFWTSGLIKETLAMASLYFISGIFIRLWVGKNVDVMAWLTCIVACYLLWSLKYYFAGIFLAVIVASLGYKLISFRLPSFARGFRSYGLWFSIFLLLITGVSFLHPNFSFARLLNVMVQNYRMFHQVSRVGTVVEFENLQPTFLSVLANSPEALFTGLFRPLFFDATNLLSILLSVENLGLLIMTPFALPQLAKIVRSKASILLVAIIVYVILLAIFITLSTPNFGTLARYRVGYLPFFVFLILLAPPVATRLLKLFNRFAKV